MGRTKLAISKIGGRVLMRFRIASGSKFPSIRPPAELVCVGRIGGGEGWAQAYAGEVRINPRNLPAANNLIGDARQAAEKLLAMTEGQLIQVAEPQLLPANVGVIGTLQEPLVLILLGAGAVGAKI